MVEAAPGGGAPQAVRRLLVTGGTGSLGRALITFAVSREQYSRVVCFSRDEFKQEMMSATPPWREYNGKALRFFIGDVRDSERLDLAMHGITDVVHAAALKWVAGGVYNVDEMVKTNIQGTINVIKAAINAGVERVLLIASDKGCHPANTYGASKFMAEQYAVQANSFSFPRGTRVSVVRYGNVLWSRGSVAHRFWTAKPYQLTDARMTRFGITLPQAVTWVQAALEGMRGGEIFVPQLPSFRVVDVAHARYHTAYPLRDTTPIQITGLRPGGEKLHEKLITEEESTRAFYLRLGPGWTGWAGWVIEPVFRSWDRDPWGGEPVPEGWCYTSDKNPEWMSEHDVAASFSDMDQGLPSV